MGLFDFGIDTEVKKEDEREQDLTQSFVNGLQSAFGLNAKNVAGAIDWSAMIVTSALNPMSDDNKYYKSFKNSSFSSLVLKPYNVYSSSLILEYVYTVYSLPMIKT